MIRGGLDCAIARALAYAPYADLCGARRPLRIYPSEQFAEAVRAKHPTR